MPVPYQYGYNTPRYPTSRPAPVARDMRPYATGQPWAPQAGGTPRNFYRGGIYDEGIGALGRGSHSGPLTSEKEAGGTAAGSTLNGPEFYNAGAGRSSMLATLATGAIAGAIGAGAYAHHAQGKVAPPPNSGPSRPPGRPPRARVWTAGGLDTGQTRMNTGVPGGRGPAPDVVEATYKRPYENAGLPAETRRRALSAGNQLALNAGPPGLPAGSWPAPPAGNSAGPEGSGHFVAPYSPLDSKYNLKKYKGRSNPSFVDQPLDNPAVEAAVEVRSWVEGQSRAQRRSNNRGATKSVWEGLYE